MVGESLRPSKPKTIGGWITLILSLGALIGAIMGAGAWIYKVENGYTVINNKLDKIDSRLNTANTVIDQRFKELEKTQVDLKIAIGIAAALESERNNSTIRAGSPRSRRTSNSSRLGAGRAAAPTPAEPDPPSNSDEEKPTAKNLERRLKSAQTRLNKVSKQSFAF